MCCTRSDCLIRMYQISVNINSFKGMNLSIDLIATASLLFSIKPCVAQDPIVSEHVPSIVIWIPPGIIYDFQCDGFEFYVVCNDDKNLSILSAWTHKYQIISI